ncbi:hypothetical protein VIGAN_06186200 [Vigna angularis var. angularis]|uniref:Uncharacterized protein n=2 Tax=Phaseolus angularis TaxID=3914 RepID=A0A0S3SCQ5_PHAAN|nr:hypothetical protein VIGAN_06186200 [Vigna angularis var. angularis]
MSMRSQIMPTKDSLRIEIQISPWSSPNLEGKNLRKLHIKILVDALTKKILPGSFKKYFLMKSIFWSIRGIGNPASRTALSFVNHKLDFVIIAEPWVEPLKTHVAFWNSISLKLFVVNNRRTAPPKTFGAFVQSHLAFYPICPTSRRNLLLKFE